MDSKTTALLKQGKLHTQGAVTASFDPVSGNFTVTAYPPATSYTVDPYAMLQAKDNPMMLQGIANNIGKSVAATVEAQVYAAWDTDAQTAMKNSYEEKVAALQDPLMHYKKYFEEILSNKITDAITVHMAPPPKADRTEVTAVFHDLIPGFAEMRHTGCPDKSCHLNDDDDPDTNFLQDIIIHLNDHHQWTREAIADWLETTDHDLRIKSPEEVKHGNCD